MELFLYTALFSPLVGSLFAATMVATPKKIIAGIVPSILLVVSFLSSSVLLSHVLSGETVHVELMTWMAAGNLYIPFGFVVDQVSVTMMMVVTIVSSVVHVYAIGYMDHDKSFNRFFAWLSAFVFSMLILVMSDNYAGLFIGWEGVGLWRDRQRDYKTNDHLAGLMVHRAVIMQKLPDDIFCH